MRVKTGRKYIYSPTFLDVIDARTALRPGDVVRVIKLPGCPPPNTMGHAHVEKVGNEETWGLVSTNSLQPIS